MNKKLENIRDVARTAIHDGNYVRTKHAAERMSERGITLEDALRVIRSGWHDEKNDEFDQDRGWSYCFVGSTLDNDQIIVPIGISKNSKGHLVVIITVKEA